jgi:hypothetical protein
MRPPTRTAKCDAVKEPQASDSDTQDGEPKHWDLGVSKPSSRLMVNGQDLPAFEDVSTAHFRIRNGVVRTPLVRSRQLSSVTGMNIFLKHEWQQATGSFKERGARNALLALDDEQRKRGTYFPPTTFRLPDCPYSYQKGLFPLIVCPYIAIYGTDDIFYNLRGAKSSSPRTSRRRR